MPDWRSKIPAAPSWRDKIAKPELEDPGFDPMVGIRDRAAEAAPTSVDTVGMQTEPTFADEYAAAQQTKMEVLPKDTMETAKGAFYGFGQGQTIDSLDNIVSGVDPGYAERMKKAEADAPIAFQAGAFAGGMTSPLTKIPAAVGKIPVANILETPFKAAWPSILSGLQSVGLAEDIKTPEDFAKAFGTGVTLHQVSNLILGGAGKAVQKGMRNAAARRAVQSQEGVEKVLKSLGFTTKQRDAFVNQYGDDALAEATKLVQEIPVNQEAAARKIANELDPIGQRIEQAYQTVDDMRGPDAPTFLGNTEKMKESLDKLIKGKAISAPLRNAKNILDTPNPSMSALWEKRKEIGKIIQARRQARDFTDMDHLKALQSAIDADLFTNMRAAGGKDVYEQLMQDNAQYSQLKDKLDRVHSFRRKFKPEINNDAAATAFQFAARTGKKVTGAVGNAAGNKLSYLFEAGQNGFDKLPPPVQEALRNAWKQGDSRFLATHHTLIRTNPEYRRFTMNQLGKAAGLVSKVADSASDYIEKESAEPGVVDKPENDK